MQMDVARVKMLVGLWSPKGGSGVSTVTAACALAARRSMRTIVVDPWGDLTALLAVRPPSVGWHDLIAASELPLDAIDRVAVEVDDGLRLVAPGESRCADCDVPSAIANEVGADLREALCAADSMVIVDLGRGECGAMHTLAALAGALVCVIRPCYLALRRGLAHPMRGGSNGVFVIEEAGRSLTPHDVASTLHLRELGAVRLRPAVARAIDAGTFAVRPDEATLRAADTMLRRLDLPAGLRRRVVA